MILPFRVLKKVPLIPLVQAVLFVDPSILVLQRVGQLQMNKAAQIYLLMYQLVWEDKQHLKFWAQFGQSLLYAYLALCLALDGDLSVNIPRNALSMMKNELMNVVLKAGQDWNSYRQKIEDFLVDWEKFNSALLRYAALSSNAQQQWCLRNMLHSISAAEQTEGTLLRKNLTIVKKAIKEINTSVGASKLPETKQALESVQELLHRAYVS